MTDRHQHFFSLHELLTMAALAALGGITSSALSNIRAAAHSLLPNPIGMQPLAGVHVLWLIIAVGLIRKPGAALATSLLCGTIELLAGNPHGLLVFAYSALGGLGVDAAWLLLGHRHHLATYMIAGGTGAAANVVVLAFGASLPTDDAVIVVLGLMSGVAFISGALLAGVLGWWLLRSLRQAGVGGAPVQRHQRQSNDPV